MDTRDAGHRLRRPSALGRRRRRRISRRETLFKRRQRSHRLHARPRLCAIVRIAGKSASGFDWLVPRATPRVAQRPCRKAARRHHARAAASDPDRSQSTAHEQSCERPGHLPRTAHVLVEAGLKDNHRPGLAKPLECNFRLADTQPAHRAMLFRKRVEARTSRRRLAFNRKGCSATQHPCLASSAVRWACGGRCQIKAKACVLTRPEIAEVQQLGAWRVTACGGLHEGI